MSPAQQKDDVATEHPDEQPPVEVSAEGPIEPKSSEQPPAQNSGGDSGGDSGGNSGGEELTETDQPIDYDTLQPQIEALLISSDRPLKAGRIAEACDLPATKPVKTAIDYLNAFYEEHHRAFRIQQLPDGFQLHTLPQFKDQLTHLHQNKTKVDNKLSAAGLETLAIVAYKQPILRAQVEAVRGVASGEVLRSLMDKQLVKIVGRAEELGRPMLYGTTKTFLQVFGMATLKDLPKAEDFNKP